jgi:TRAP-type transport system periplasmic protein
MKKKRGIASWVAASVWTILFVAFLTFLGAATVSAGEPSSKTYNWKMTSYFSPGTRTNNPPLDFIKTLEERSKGAVKISFYEGTLGAPPDHWEMCRGNAIQLAFIADVANPGRLPMVTLMDFPFEFDSVVETMTAANEMWKAGYFKEITDNFHLVGFMPNLHIQTLFFRNKKVTSMADMKGLKIRAAGSMIGKTVTALGGQGVSMPAMEIYMAMQTGVIDGFITGADYIGDQKLYEVTKYALREPMSAGIFIIVMNKETWNSLPKDIQTLIDKTAAEVGANWTKKNQVAAENDWVNMGTKMKMEVYKLSPEERARWKKATAPLIEAYVQEQTAKGLPAKAALELMRKVAEGKK